MESRYLYRGKRIDNGKWVEGSLVTGVFFRLGQEIPYMFCPNLADYDCFEDFSEENGIFEVEPSTICQCTGLKDRNGKLIWENDMVKGAYFVNGKEHRFIGKVGYVGSAFKVVGVKQYSGMRQELHSVYAIIGNIFDNPELLE